MRWFKSLPPLANGIFITKTANLRIFDDVLGVLVQMPDCLAGWIDVMGFSPIICKCGFDPVLGDVASGRRRKVNWSCIDLKHPYFLNRWRIGKVISSTDKCVHERKQEVHGRFFYHERWLLSISVRFKCVVRLSSLDDAVTVTPDAFGDERSVSSSGGNIVPVRTVACDDEGDSDI